jgi:hypothetical protein
MLRRHRRAHRAIRLARTLDLLHRARLRTAAAQPGFLEEAIVHLKNEPAALDFLLGCAGAVPARIPLAAFVGVTDTMTFLVYHKHGIWFDNCSDAEPEQWAFLLRLGVVVGWTGVRRVPKRRGQVDPQHPLVCEAINAVKRHMDGMIEHFPESFLPGITTFDPAQPWVHFIPAATEEECTARSELIARYGGASPTSIDHYIMLHCCYIFTIFYWCVLASQGISGATLAAQQEPHAHAYVVLKDGSVADPLYARCGITYPYRPAEATHHTLPHFFQAEFTDWVAETAAKRAADANLAQLTRLGDLVADS